MQLREYEQDWVTRISQSQAKRIAIVGPTGSGKTVVAAELVRRAVKIGQRVLVIAHRRELVAQAISRLRESGITRINHAQDEDYGARVAVRSIQSLFWMKEPPPADLVVIDEAHHALADSYQEVLKHYPSATVYGLTATPYRYDGQPLGSLFKDLIPSAPPSELVAAGWLSKPKIYTVPANQRPKLLGLRKRGGDFDNASLARVADLPHLIGSIVTHYKRYAGKRPTVVYTVNVRHAQHVAEQFWRQRINAAVLIAETPVDDRIRILEGFENREIPVLVNCLILTEGWDCPSARCAIIARPTLSPVLWHQMVGRVTRPGDEPPIVLDHAGNALLHGAPLEDVPYSLERRLVKPPSLKRLLEKVCPQCDNALVLGAPSCGWCGFVFWEPGDLPETARGQLVPLGDRRPWIRCSYSQCPKPEKLVHSSSKRPMHRECKALQRIKPKQCTYEHCARPDLPIKHTNQWQMHRECHMIAEGRVGKKPVRCIYPKCPTPDEMFLSRSKRPMHQACQTAHALVMRKCTYDKCETPDVLLGKKYMVGKRMHRACAGRHRSEQVSPSAERCCVCGIVRKNKIKDVAGKLYCPRHIPKLRKREQRSNEIRAELRQIVDNKRNGRSSRQSGLQDRLQADVHVAPGVGLPQSERGGSASARTEDR